MALTEDEKAGVGVALNEAAWLDIAVDEAARRVTLGFRVLALPSEETLVSVVLDGVTRLAASLRTGVGADAAGTVLPLTIAGLPGALWAFEGQPVYGWEFLDLPDDSWAHWRDRLSLNARYPGEAAHSMKLFQESGSRHLDVRIWFRDLAVVDRVGQPIPLERFITAGRQWWDAFFAGDPRTAGHGLFPGKRTRERPSDEESEEG